MTRFKLLLGLILHPRRRPARGTTRQKGMCELNEYYPTNIDLMQAEKQSSEKLPSLDVS